VRRVLVALALAGAVAAAAPAWAAQRDDDVERGRALYVTGCSSCHGPNGEGADGYPTLVGVGAAAADFYLSTGRMPLDQPTVQAARKEPAYSQDEIDDLVAFVASLGDGPAVPAVDPAAGSLVEGRELYTAFCAACHNSQGSGGALGRDYFAPSLFDATPVQTAEAVRVGPGAMPVFNAETIDQGELDSIVRYVEYLKDPRDRGGLSLGRVGPVPEGFVAWVVGLGALLLAAFWIGTRE
jgi:ubiquinol-cytochrome c reductase cytochrome c subunit